jgi:hypothetical protein
MSSVWKQTPTENAIITVPVHQRIETPTQHQLYYQAEAIQEYKRDFLTPNIYSQDAILYLLAEKHTGWSRRQSNTIKRYLVFCQLKIGD